MAVVLAFFFGYTLTMVPLLRSGLALAAVLPLAFASDTLSITIMEIVDNLVMLAIPDAMEAGLTSLLFWGSAAFALGVAFIAALPANRWLIACGRGHAVVHQYHAEHHGDHEHHYAADLGAESRSPRRGPLRKGAQGKMSATHETHDEYASAHETFDGLTINYVQRGVLRRSLTAALQGVCCNPWETVIL